MSFLDISEDKTRGTVGFTVRVQPRASRDGIAGVLKTAKSAVRIRSGEQSRTKRVEIFGVTRQQIESLLQVEA